MERRILLKTLNPFITCNICKGYLIDATAITECLHTFCKSCLVKHIEANTTCPTCRIVIHHSYPRQYINYDRTMQDIVYKLVPGLLESEVQRETEFYQARGLPNPKDTLAVDETRDNEIRDKEDLNVGQEISQPELISVCLECFNKGKLLSKMFIRLPTKTTIAHLKKFLNVRFLNSPNAGSYDVICNCEILKKSDSLKYVYITKWKFDNVPLVLQCQRVT